MTTRPRKKLDWLPVALIAGGILLLIANLGGLGWQALIDVLWLWPVALIAIGVDVLLGGRHRLVVIVGALVVAGLMLVRGGPAEGLFGDAIPVGAGAVAISQPLGGASRAEVVLAGGVNRFEVIGSDDPALLIGGRVETARNERLEESYGVDGDTVRYRLASETERPGGRIDGGRRVWHLALTRQVPLDLTISTGVGASSLELADLRIERLAVDTGVGATDLSLPGRGRYTAGVNTGVGGATIRLPADLAARITVSRGVGAVTVRGEFERAGDTYTSPGFDAAENRVDLRVDGGVGSITVLGER